MSKWIKWCSLNNLICLGCYFDFHDPPFFILTHKAIQQGLAAMLYAGVTTGLDMGSTHSYILKEKNKIDAGEYIAPRYHIVGVPLSQAPSGWGDAVRRETVGEPAPDTLATKIYIEGTKANGAILSAGKT